MMSEIYIYIHTHIYIYEYMYMYMPLVRDTFVMNICQESCQFLDFTLSKKIDSLFCVKSLQLDSSSIGILIFNV